MSPEERARDVLQFEAPAFIIARVAEAIRAAERDARNAALEEAAAVARQSFDRWEQGDAATQILALKSS